jgi:glyoxylase-like metal-dependent hydrolase (beta-lactamase superfamily II)
MILRLITALCLIPAAVLPAQDGLVSQKLSQNVLVIKKGGANVTVICTDEGLVMVDTFNSPGAARRGRKLIEAFSDKPIRYAINTHYHADHSFGNQVFDDAVIISTHDYARKATGRYSNRDDDLQKGIDEMKEQLKTAEPGSEQAEALAREIGLYRRILADSRGFILIPPEISLKGSASLILGSRTFNILYAGTAHTHADLVVHVPEENLLVMGDIFWDRYIPYIDLHESDPLGWIAFLNKLSKLNKEIEYVVPGHGDVQGPEALTTMLRLMQKLWDAVADARESGLSLEQAKQEIKLEEYSGYARHPGRVPMVVEACWRAMERGNAGKDQ